MIRLAVRVPRAHAEIVLAELLELAPSGVEEVDVDAETVEYAVYGAPGELPAIGDVRAAAGATAGIPVDVSSSEIADDWAQRWREFHRPLVIGRELTVRPPWEAPGDTELDVVIDPGQAFGTGAHATTALCLELLLAEAREGAPGASPRSCVDLGCGSGVLAIVAARLGFAPVLALDYDPLAIAATDENARRAGVSVTARRLDLRVEQVPDADLALANVLAGPLLAWARTQERLAPRLILSGLLATEADRVAQAYAARGLRERTRRVRGDWAALLLAADVA
jgi:ribosomal protein L11 methyltransferase